MLGLVGIWGFAGNPEQCKLPGIHEGVLNEDSQSWGIYTLNLLCLIVKQDFQWREWVEFNWLVGQGDSMEILKHSRLLLRQRVALCNWQQGLTANDNTHNIHGTWRSAVPPWRLHLYFLVSLMTEVLCMSGKTKIQRWMEDMKRTRPSELTKKVHFSSESEAANSGATWVYTRSSAYII